VFCVRVAAFLSQYGHRVGDSSPLPEVRTERELEVALHALGWNLDGPRRTAGGWKATIQRGTVTVLSTGSKPEEILETLLRDAEERAKHPGENP
jgi:hypothetical protein